MRAAEGLEKRNTTEYVSMQGVRCHNNIETCERRSEILCELLLIIYG